MLIEEKKWYESKGWVSIKPQTFSNPPQLVLVFGAKKLFEDGKYFDEIKSMYPQSHIVMSSAAGEIMELEVSDGTISLAAILFEKTTIQCVEADIADTSQSQEVGRKLASSLPKEELIHVLVLSEGITINASGLILGLTQDLPNTVSVTGGLAGDISTRESTNFKETLLGLDKPPVSKKIIAIGFYGNSLKVGYGSIGGWDAFGPERLITKSLGNVLYELDNKPALDLYKEYLGERAKELPGAGLFFPMRIRFTTLDNKEIKVVRTFFSVNEEEKSLTLVGEMPQNGYATLMRANFEHIIDGAADAANSSIESIQGSTAQLAILISCIGRKLVLKERTEEEIEAVQSVVGKQASIIGFYSYGEICPILPTEKQCQFHNQTMTITTFREE